MTQRRTKVAIDVRISGDGSTGSMQQVLIGLVAGLASLKEPDMEYVFITNHDASSWLGKYLASNQSLYLLDCPSNRWREKVKLGLGPLKTPLLKAYRKWKRLLWGPPQFQLPVLPISDGVAEQLKVDLLHLAYSEQFYRSEIPTVCSIYDLQHLHLPDYFPEVVLKWREAVYLAMFHHSNKIFTISESTKTDVVSHYKIPEEKIEIAHLGPVNAYYPEIHENDLIAFRNRFGLPEKFLFFPALMYGHKNHLALLDAMAHLRDTEGLTVFLLACGKKEFTWREIEEKVKRLNLAHQVIFPGFLTEVEMRCAYQLALALIFPSRFEGAGLPLIEAMQEGLAIACSDLPAHREYAGEAALFFDPSSVDSIAKGISRIWNDELLRSELIRKGKLQVTKFSWTNVARQYSLAYRKVLQELSASGSTKKP